MRSRPLDFSSIKSGLVEQMSSEPAEIVKQLKSRSFKHAYIDGGIAIKRFLAARCIDRMVITRVPVLIGAGIPLFGPLPRDIGLRHIATRSYYGGWCRVNMRLALRCRNSETAIVFDTERSRSSLSGG